MERSSWSLQQEERGGKKDRNEYICWLVNAGGRGIQAYAAYRYGLTRQRINQLVKRGKKKSLLKRVWDWIRGK